MGLILFLLCFYKADVDRAKTDLLLLGQEQNSPLNNWPSQACNSTTQCTAAGVVLSAPQPLWIFPRPCLSQRTARLRLRCCDRIHSVQSSDKNEALCIFMEKHTRSCEPRCHE